MTVTTSKASGLIAAAVLLLAASIGDARTKIDVLTFDNGDTMTCEIKQMERGLVNVKTTYMKGTVAIEWIHVEQMESEQLFEVETADGTKYFGSIETSVGDLSLTVVTERGDITVAHGDVVRMAPIDESFWERLRGDVDLGLTAKKANEEKQFNLSGSLRYRTRKYQISTILNSFVSRFDEAPSTERNHIGIAYRRALRGKWFWTAYTRFENNRELGLDLRTTLAGGGGKFIIQNNRSEMSWTTGLAGNEELYTDAQDPQDNLEGFLLLEYQYFMFGDRETSISVAAAALPSFSISNRVRYSLAAKYRHELIRDLYFAVGLVADYDSNPPTQEGESADWNFTTSLGYSF
jgi:hypothetical protein